MNILKYNSYDIVNDKLRAAAWEKIQHAEYGTPFSLRLDMIKLLPTNFWKKKNIKILEPAVGKGGFVVDIIQKLMISLGKVIPDKMKRYKHIVENIIYFADINRANVKKLAKLLDPSGIFELNYFIGDSISDKISLQNIFGVKGFDLVIGNPPYNISGKTGTGNTIYQDFIKLALEEWILPNGYLLFVTPPSWRKPMAIKSKNKGLWELMTRDNYLIYLEIHDAKDGRKMFNAGTRYDFYLIKKTEPKTTIVIDQLGEKHRFHMKDYPWLPNYNFKFIKKLLAGEKDKKVDILFNVSYYSQKEHMRKEKTKKHHYICIHSTPKKGIRYFYSSTDKLGHFGIPKVIFGDSGPATAIVNDKGKYCMTEHSMAIIDDKKNLGKILEALKSEKMRDLFASALWSSFQIDWRMFSYFKKDFYKEFL